MNLKNRNRSNRCVYIVWKTICHTSCDGGVCCPRALSSPECMAAAWRQAQVGVLVPALQSSHLAQIHPSSVHVCGLSGPENVHVETLNKQHGPNLVFTLKMFNSFPPHSDHCKAMPLNTSATKTQRLLSGHSVPWDTMWAHW